MLQGLVDLALAPEDLAYHHMNRGLLRYLVLELQEHLERLVLAVQGHEDVGLLELVEGVFLVDGFGLLEPTECLLRQATVVSDHAHVRVQNGRALIDLDGAVEQLRSLLKLLLLEIDVAETPPCVIMPLVSR